MYKFLRNYIATPSSSTGIAPATTGDNLTSTNSGTRQCVETKRQGLENEDERYADRKRHAKSRAIVPGNVVLARQPRRDKLTSQFDHRPYTVIQKTGRMITAQRGDRDTTRNSSHFKPVKLKTTVIIESDNDKKYRLADRDIVQSYGRLPRHRS